MGPKQQTQFFNKLCETFKRLGTDEWIDVYRLGQELGFSTEQVREGWRSSKRTSNGKLR